MGDQSFSTAHIEYLEKDFLDVTGQRIEASSLQFLGVRDFRYLHIKGLSSFWISKERKTLSLQTLMEDVLSGLFEAAIPVVFAILGRPGNIGVYSGTFAVDGASVGDNLETLEVALRSAFQGIEIDRKDERDVSSRLDEFTCCSLLTGTPADKAGNRHTEFEQIERLIRGLYGRTWGYFVVANPLKNSETNALFNSVLNETRVVLNAEKSLDRESPTSKKYKELLQGYLTKLQAAKAQGMFHTATFLYSDEPRTLRHISAVVKSVLGGKKSLPDRIRVLDVNQKIERPDLVLNIPSAAPGQFRYPYSFMSTLNSADLARLAHLPSQETPGFQVKAFARFSVCTTGCEPEGLTVGEILDLGKGLGVPYTVSVKDLTKHALIAGTTGSGKTNTLFHLLKGIWKQKIPFLVIEPVKSEYRRLILSREVGSDLQVFTLGDNNVSPFRLNPFEVLPGVSVQSHIDLVKAVFNASFFMWGPLPQVLERCLHEIYLDKGWDLVSNQNLRGIHPDAYPTLADLHNKVDDVVSHLGYSPETNMEVRSALKTRIDSMRIGAKGLMLDVRRSMPFESYLDRPTILELEALADDEEKAFMMGLILTRIYERYVSLGTSQVDGVGHVTVIEEAHRLLAQHQKENPYAGNVRGKAVETFSNILSEIRAYGEGFLIAEQIPAKLASDVIKNTNLKIMHRMVAEDDRKAMGAAMNVDEKETARVAAFHVGEAAVYSEGDEGPFHVQAPRSKAEPEIGVWRGKGDEQVRAVMEPLRRQNTYLAPFAFCLEHCQAICRYKNVGEAIACRGAFLSQMPSVLLSVAADAAPSAPFLLQMLETGSDEAAHVKDSKGVKLCSAIHGGERYFGRLGNDYFWSYEDVEKIKHLFLIFYETQLNNYLASGGNESSVAYDPADAAELASCYRELCSQRQPARFCSLICTNGVCLYRFNLVAALEDNYYHRKFVQTVNQGGDELWRKLYGLCREAVEEIVLPGGNEESLRRMTLCFAMQKSHTIKSFGRRHVQAVMDHLIGISRDHQGPADRSV